MSSKKDDGPSKEEVFKTFKKVMVICDEAVNDVLDDGAADISDMSSQIVNVMMAIEFSYVCYRNRLKVFMDSLNDAAEMEVFDDEDLKDAVDYARICLQPLLKSAMIADRRRFERSLEVVSLDDITDPETRINVKGGDA
jgi:hypothetical protein